MFVDHFVETVRARVGAEISDRFSYDSIYRSRI